MAAWLQCIKCARTYDEREIRYTCDCGDLLSVERSEGWSKQIDRATFDARLGSRSDAKPFGLMFEALDGLKPGEIYICTGSSPTYALWGGLMSTRARALGASGAVLDGYHRDTREILQLGFLRKVIADQLAGRLGEQDLPALALAVGEQQRVVDRLVALAL